MEAGFSSSQKIFAGRSTDTVLAASVQELARSLERVPWLFSTGAPVLNSFARKDQFQNISSEICQWFALFCPLTPLPLLPPATNTLSILLFQVFPASSYVSENSMGQTPLCRALRVAGKPTGQEANTWAEVRSYHNGETFALKGQSAIHPGQFNNRDRGLVFSSCFPKENYLFLLSEIYVFSLTTEGFIRHPCSCQKNQLDYWACSSFFLPLFTSYSEELVCSPCLCCPTWWGIALHSPKHCPYSLWWLLILNFGAHGAPCAACTHPNNHTLVSHWNLAAVGLVVSSPLPGDQQSPAQPRDVGPRSLSVPGLAHPVSPMCRTGLCCPFHYHRQSCCSLIPWQSPWIPSVPGGCWLQKKASVSPSSQVGWQIRKFAETMKK